MWKTVYHINQIGPIDFFGMLDLAYVSILEKSRGSILELCSDAVNRIEYSEL